MTETQQEIFPVAEQQQVEQQTAAPQAEAAQQTVDPETGEVIEVPAEKPRKRRRTRAEVQAEREAKALETVQAIKPEHPEPDIKDQDIYVQLAYIQKNVKAPKRLLSKNVGSDFPYRSYESIIEDTKNLIQGKCGCVIVADQVTTPIEVGGKIAVSAVVALVNNRGQRVESSAPVIIDFSKSPSFPQAVGSAISYARKYALNGLLALDDVKTDAVIEPDCSTLEKKEQQTAKPAPKPAPEVKPEVKSEPAPAEQEKEPEAPKTAAAPAPETKKEPHEVQAKEKLTTTSPAWSSCIATAAVFTGTGEELVKAIRAKFDVEDSDLRTLCAIAGKQFPSNAANA